MAVFRGFIVIVSETLFCQRFCLEIDDFTVSRVETLENLPNSGRFPAHRSRGHGAHMPSATSAGLGPLYGDDAHSPNASRTPAWSAETRCRPQEHPDPMSARSAR